MQTSYTGLVITSDLKPGDDIRLLARQISHSSHIVHVVPPLTGLSQIATANLLLPDLIFPTKSCREVELVLHTKKEAPQRPLKRWMTYSPRSTPSTGLAHPHAQTSRHMGHPLTAASYPALLGTACLGEIWGELKRIGFNVVFWTKDIFICFILVWGIFDYLGTGIRRNLKTGLLRICHLEKFIL